MFCFDIESIRNNPNLKSNAVLTDEYVFYNGKIFREADGVRYDYKEYM